MYCTFDNNKTKNELIIVKTFYFIFAPAMPWIDYFKLVFFYENHLWLESKKLFLLLYNIQYIL